MGITSEKQETPPPSQSPSGLLRANQLAVNNKHEQRNTENNKPELIAINKQGKRLKQQL